MKLKYLKIDDGLSESIILFPLHIQHADIASMLHYAVITAGFVTKENDKWICYGESFSLGIKSDSVDSIILEKMMKE